MTLQEFNSKYSYMSDIEQWGVDDLWEIITYTQDGYYYGDCE
jgi:predicted transglutaminase-like cysteine proteinase